jgi:hypothetical protein
MQRVLQEKNFILHTECLDRLFGLGKMNAEFGVGEWAFVRPACRW